MPPRVDPTGRRAATADADADDGDRAPARPDAVDGRDPAVNSARVFMSFAADASRFGEAFARTSRNAFGKDMSTEKVSDATWRKAMFQGWGEREEPTTKTKTTAPTNAEETSGAKNETFIVDVDDFRSSHGRSQTYISQEEYVERAEYFERVMREQFLAGGDEDFDYAAVDGDDGLDEHWRKERDQDAEDRYFDED